MSIPAISQRDLRNDSAAIMDRVERGESFTVTRNRKPVATLTPLAAGPQESKQNRFVPSESLAGRFSLMPPGSFQSLRSDADDFFHDGGDRA